METPGTPAATPRPNPESPPGSQPTDPNNARQRIQAQLETTAGGGSRAGGVVVGEATRVLLEHSMTLPLRHRAHARATHLCPMANSIAGLVA